MRVNAEGLIKLEDLSEAWRALAIPLAITECHNGCTREEQLRWVGEIWKSCRVARRSGVDLRAVTASSFFGAVDSNTLVHSEQ